MLLSLPCKRTWMGGSYQSQAWSRNHTVSATGFSSWLQWELKIAFCIVCVEMEVRVNNLQWFCEWAHASFILICGSSLQSVWKKELSYWHVVPFSACCRVSQLLTWASWHFMKSSVSLIALNGSQIFFIGSFVDIGLAFHIALTFISAEKEHRWFRFQWVTGTQWPL